MPRFFLSKDNISNNEIYITGQDADHIRVLRHKAGDEITVCDGEGNDYLCRISDISKEGVLMHISSSMPSNTESAVKCTIFCGLPKGGEKAEFIVQKCTEMGASGFVFFLSSRCVARPDPKSADKKLLRLSRIAEEAAKQSGRGTIPTVSFLPTFREAITLASESPLALFMYETGDRISLCEAIEPALPLSDVSIMTGPEGGFEQAEAEEAMSMGMKCCSMGRRILRCETAPMAALTAVLYAQGEL